MRDLRSHRDLEAAVITISLPVVGSYVESLAGRLKGCFAFLVGTTKFVETLSTGLLAGVFKFLTKTTLVGTSLFVDSFF